MVDDPQQTLRLLGLNQLLDDFRNRVGIGTDRAGAWRAAQRPHAALHHLRLLTGHRHDERLLLHDQRVATDDDLALFRVVHRHDRDVLDVDVLPDVDLGPVREREYANAFARTQLAVQQVPQLRALTLGVPLAVRVANREDALLGAGSLLVAPGAADGRVEVASRQAVQQRLGLQQAAAALRADLVRLRPFADRLFVGVNDEPRPDLRGHAVAELDHFAELVGRVDVQQGERNRTG